MTRILERLFPGLRGPAPVPVANSNVQVVRPMDPGIVSLPHEEGRWPISLGLSVGWRKRWVRPNGGGIGISTPQTPPNPAFPNGRDVDMAPSAVGRCAAILPQYPGQLGMYAINCATCGRSVEVTSAGKTDDPRLVRVACKWGRA